MYTLVSIGDVLFFAGGFAACWFGKPWLDAVIAWVKAKF